MPALPSHLVFFTWEALGVWLAWLALILLLHVVLPGEMGVGTVLRNGRRLKYKVRGDRRGRGDCTM